MMVSVTHEKYIDPMFPCNSSSFGMPQQKHCRTALRCTHTVDCNAFLQVSTLNCITHLPVIKVLEEDSLNLSHGNLVPPP